MYGFTRSFTYSQSIHVVVVPYITFYKSTTTRMCCCLLCVCISVHSVMYTFCCLCVWNLSFLSSNKFCFSPLYFQYYYRSNILLVFTPYTIFHVLFHVKYVNIIVFKQVQTELEQYLSIIAITVDVKKVIFKIIFELKPWMNLHHKYFYGLKVFTLFLKHIWNLSDF